MATAGGGVDAVFACQRCAKEASKRDRGRVVARACGRSRPTRGLTTPVHHNRRQGEHGVDGRGLDVDEPPPFLDDGEKRIDLDGHRPLRHH